MQQGPYHSPVIDIPSPAKLIAGTPVKQPHETEGRGKRWWELSLHCMCKWESESKKQTKEGDTFQQHGDKGWKNMRKERKSNLESEWKDYLTERERGWRERRARKREKASSRLSLCVMSFALPQVQCQLPGVITVELLCYSIPGEISYIVHITAYPYRNTQTNTF